MPRQSWKSVLWQFCRAGQGRAADGATDGDLLTRFIAHEDAEAFAALLARHGPLVWGVCRRVVPNVYDAEDAFQATFLVLARKAAAVRRADSVGGWLYQVALRVALRARSAVRRYEEIDPEFAANDD